MTPARFLLACLTVAAVVALPAANAQQKKVYRCEVAGKVTYGDAPCKDAVELKTDPAPTEAQRKAAREVAATDKKLAEQMAHERREREKAAAGQRAAHIPYGAAERAAIENTASRSKAKPPARKPARAEPPLKDPKAAEPSTQR